MDEGWVELRDLIDVSAFRYGSFSVVSGRSFNALILYSERFSPFSCLIFRSEAGCRKYASGERAVCGSAGGSARWWQRVLSCAGCSARWVAARVGLDRSPGDPGMLIRADGVHLPGLLTTFVIIKSHDSRSL
jgi:hypothetical protein